MKNEVTRTPAAEIEADAVVAGVSETQPLSGLAEELNTATGGLIQRLIESGDVRGKSDEVKVLVEPPGLRAPRLVLVGLGSEPPSRGTVFRAAAAAAKRLSGRARGRIAFYLAASLDPAIVESGVCGAMVGCTGQDLYRTEKKMHAFETALWSTPHAEALASGSILANGMNLTRRLVNEPPSDMTPEKFAQVSRDVAHSCGLEIDVWDRARLEAERCGALLAVARGSAQPPRLVIVEHRASRGAPAIALVGKGVTFDSGGLSLKPSDSMKTMKCDMAGAATVLGAMQAIAQLNLDVHVIGLAGLVENMVSGDSYKLGDVLHARSGKTIEIHNTDAEGRLVLADVLDVAVERQAERIIDLATLTGACVVALGMDVAGLMTNDQAWCDRVAESARACGELVWQLPMFPDFASQIRSDVADIKNVGDGRWGGAITAAKFLEEFVGKTPWTHIDIAGPSFLEKPKPWMDGGGSGALVRTLVDVVRSLAAEPAA